jgi:hypothetical protein
MTNLLCVGQVALLSVAIAGCAVGDSGPGVGPKVKPDDAQAGTCYKVANTDACGLPAGVWVRNPHGDGSVDQCSADARWTAYHTCTDYYPNNNNAWVQSGYSDDSGNWLYGGYGDGIGFEVFGNCCY